MSWLINGLKDFVIVIFWVMVLLAINQPDFLW